jgi:hypothetical protein
MFNRWYIDVAVIHSCLVLTEGGSSIIEYELQLCRTMLCSRYASTHGALHSQPCPNKAGELVFRGNATLTFPLLLLCESGRNCRRRRHEMFSTHYLSNSNYICKLFFAQEVVFDPLFEKLMQIFPLPASRH